MSTVGIVSIVLGVFAVGIRGPLLVAPAEALRWYKEVIATNNRIRLLGAVTVTLGAAMVWAGASEDTGLATILTLFGLAAVGVSVPLMLLFPGIYRGIASPFLPSDTSGSLFLWRFGGLVGTSLGVLLIYFGALAL